MQFLFNFFPPRQIQWHFFIIKDRFISKNRDGLSGSTQSERIMFAATETTITFFFFCSIVQIKLPSISLQLWGRSLIANIHLVTALWDESSLAKFQSGLSKCGWWPSRQTTGPFINVKHPHTSTLKQSSQSSSIFLLPLSSLHFYTHSFTPSPVTHPSCPNWQREGHTYSSDSQVKRLHSTSWQPDLTQTSGDRSFGPTPRSAGKWCSFQVLRVWTWTYILLSVLRCCTTDHRSGFFSRSMHLL